MVGHEKPIYSGGLPKKGAWTVCRFKGGSPRRTEGAVFERGGGSYPNAHYGISSGITFYGLSLRFQALHEIRDKEKFIRN